jgi:hypothetical protein
MRARGRCPVAHTITALGLTLLPGSAVNQQKFLV